MPTKPPSILSKTAPDLVLPAFSVTTGKGKKRKTHEYPAWNFTEEARKRGTFQNVIEKTVVPAAPVVTT